MTITVQSHDVKADAVVNKTPDASPVESASAQAQAPKEETAPAPEANASEQKEVTAESGTAATEASESETETEGLQTAGDPEGEPEAEGETVEGKEAKNKGINKRFSKITKQKAMAEARAQAAEQELNIMKQRLALRGAGEAEVDAKGAGQKPAAAEGKPDPNKFETLEAYQDARDEWNRKQWRAEQERDRVAAEQAKVQASYAEKVQAFVKAHPDYEEVMAETTAVTTPVIEQVIMTSEIGPALRYELAKNPAEAMRIAKLPPVSAAKELGKLEDRIASKSAPASAEKKQETKKTTTAPAPITPVGGGGRATQPPKSLEEAVPHRDISSDNFASFKRMREEQLKQNRSRA